MHDLHELRSLQRSAPLNTRSLIFCALGVGVFLGLPGCSKSKQDLAIEKALNRKPPAFIRFVNFSSKDLALRVRSGVVGGVVAAGGSTKFQLTGTGTEKVAVLSDGKPVFEGSVTMDSGQATSVVTTEKGTKIYGQETRDGQSGQSAIRVILASSEGSISVDSDGSPLIAKLGSESASDVTQVSPGSHSFTIKSADGKTASVSGSLTKGDAYTIFVNLAKSGATAVLAENSPMRKPISNSGLAGAG